jgi:hypothetical protein
LPGRNLADLLAAREPMTRCLRGHDCLSVGQIDGSIGYPRSVFAEKHQMDERHASVGPPDCAIYATLGSVRVMILPT